MNWQKSAKRASYLARFGYIGSHFHGLQPNRGFATAGGALYDVVHAASGGIGPKALQFSARTDAGVHALENYATFWFPRPFDSAAFVDALAHTHKHNLLYVEAREVSYHVHARANASHKWYRYVIEDSCEAEPRSKMDFSWQITPALDIHAMREAASHLIGTHDFAAFRHGGCTASSSIKTVLRIDITVTAPSPFSLRQIHIDIEGSGFLRRMVRIIAGTLAEVGAGLRDPSDMATILASQRRDYAGPSAPACGLTLMRVGFKLT